jgi:hypothetical protein
MRSSFSALAVLAGLSVSALFSGVAIAEPSKNLNSIPEDGVGTEAPKGPDNSLIRSLVTARPNEDLIICVAGCFSGRDRVVYAQPVDKAAPVVAPAAPAMPKAPDAKPPRPSALNSDKGTQSTAAATLKAAPSFDPHAPTILNMGAKASGADKTSSASDQIPTSGTN